MKWALVEKYSDDGSKLLGIAESFHDHVEDIFESFIMDELRNRLGAKEV